MTTPEPFIVRQHDRDLLAAKVTALTGEPTLVGDTQLAFLATLTPATSGGVHFSLHGDGYIESMYATCPACGQSTSGPALVDSRREAQYAMLHGLATAPKRGFLGRLIRNLAGCRTCSNDNLPRRAQ